MMNNKTWKNKRNRTHEAFDPEMDSWRVYAEKTITDRLGRQNSYTGSADWGGMPVWTVKGDKFTGVFLVIDDNSDVVLMSRELTGTGMDEYKDHDIDVVHDGDAEGLDVVLDLVSKTNTIYDRVKESALVTSFQAFLEGFSNSPDEKMSDNAEQIKRRLEEIGQSGDYTVEVNVSLGQTESTIKADMDNGDQRITISVNMSLKDFTGDSPAPQLVQVVGRMYDMEGELTNTRQWDTDPANIDAQVVSGWIDDLASGEPDPEQEATPDAGDAGVELDVPEGDNIESANERLAYSEYGQLTITDVSTDRKYTGEFRKSDEPDEVGFYDRRGRETETFYIKEADFDLLMTGDVVSAYHVGSGRTEIMLGDEADPEEAFMWGQLRNESIKPLENYTHSSLTKMGFKKIKSDKIYNFDYEKDGKVYRFKIIPTIGIHARPGSEDRLRFREMVESFANENGQYFNAKWVGYFVMTDDGTKYKLDQGIRGTARVHAYKVGDSLRIKETAGDNGRMMKIMEIVKQ